jgi:hypothetical protein
MVEHKSKTFAHTCSQSPHFCHLEVLKWVLKNGCPWNKTAYEKFVYNGNEEIISWFKENNNAV